MPPADITGFDKGSVKKIAAAVARLKYQSESIRARIRSVETRADQNAVQVRTAITGATAATPDYPAGGCQFPFHVYDIAFDAGVTGECPDTAKRERTKDGKLTNEAHVGRAIDGKYIPAGTEILYAEVPSPDGRHFWILPSGYTPGTVLFTLNEDRSREQDADDKPFGRAAATVEATVGDVPVSVGETIEVTFGGRRFLGAVGPGFAPDGKGCEGIADYYGANDDGDTWIVKVCQELTAGFWFTTGEDRDPESTDEDIALEDITKNVGHANADFPALHWKSLNGSDPLKVRFHGDSFPRAFSGAVGYAVLDVDIDNLTSNSTMRYVATICDQGAIINSVVADGFCPGETPSIRYHHPSTWFPFGQKWPAEQILRAADKMQFAMKNTGTCYTVFDETLKEHVLLGVEHAEHEFMQPPKKDTQGVCLPPAALKIQAMTCKQPTPADGLALDYAITSADLSYGVVDAGGTGSGQACSSPTLKLNYKRRPFLFCGDESELISSTIDLEQVLVTADVADDDECIYQDQVHLIVFGKCDTITENIVCTTDEQCDEE